MAKHFRSIEVRKAILWILIFHIFSITNTFAKSTALLIGIGNYNTSLTGWSVIHGNNDVELLEKKLKERDFKVSKLVDNQATKSRIISALSDLVSGALPGDIIYIHFSGHGQLIADLNKDENTFFDQTFVCYDACFSPRFKVDGGSYMGQNHLIDDQLFPYLNKLKKKVGINGEVYVVFDSCYSGGADRGDQNEKPYEDSEVEWTATTRGVDDEFKLDSKSRKYIKENISKPGNYSSGGKIIIISACKSDQKNYECKEKRSGRKYGSLSYCISKMLEENIPMSNWENFFRNKNYTKYKIFRQSQIPIVESHK